MKITVAKIVEAEGSEQELGIYTAVFLDVMQRFFEAKKEKEVRKELDLEKMFSLMSLEDLMKMEQGEDAGDDPEGGGKD